MNRINLIGKVFGRLTVISMVDSDRYGYRWMCSCECGGLSVVRGSHLRQGHIRSCGCMQGNRTATIKHGYAKKGKPSPEYSVWLAMMARCNNPKTKSYRLYGGRGISVCERWLRFKNFIADMGNRPSNKHSIDRYPNKDGNYEPGNCRWATIKEQNRNTSRNVFIEFAGKSQILEEWANELGTDPSNISRRLKKGQSFTEIYQHHKCYRFQRDDEFHKR